MRGLFALVEDSQLNGKEKQSEVENKHRGSTLVVKDGCFMQLGDHYAACARMHQNSDDCNASMVSSSEKITAPQSLLLQVNLVPRVCRSTCTFQGTEERSRLSLYTPLSSLRW